MGFSEPNEVRDKSRSDLLLPEWLEDEFWVGLDPILDRGVRIGAEGEREAAEKVIRLRPGLRENIVWARIRRFRRRLRRQQRRKAHYSRYRWTPLLDDELKDWAEQRGSSQALEHIAELTGWPRDAIARRARKLGIEVKPETERAWSEAELAYLIDNVGHISVERMVKKLRRSVRSIRSKATELGLSLADAEEGYSCRRLAEELGLSTRTVSKLVAAGQLARGRDGQIPEWSFLRFVQEHPDRINWDRLTPGRRRWLLGILDQNKRTQKPAKQRVRVVGQ